jgi:hypothetical protein
MDTTEHPINRVSAWAPFGLAAAAMVFAWQEYRVCKRYGPQTDEDGPWRMFMLAALLQAPLILLFLVKHWNDRARAWPIVFAQGLCLALDFGVLFLFGKACGAVR